MHVQIAGPATAVRDGLGRLSGVLKVHDEGSQDGAATFVVESNRGRDVRGEIFQLAAQQKWELRELRRASQIARDEHALALQMAPDTADDLGGGGDRDSYRGGRRGRRDD